MDLRNIIAGVSLFLLPLVGTSQRLLTLEEAISVAMENNYDIQLEKYNTEISENNVSRAISGQMPRFEHQASYEWGYSEAEIQTLNLNPGEAPGPPLELDGTSRDITMQPQLSVPIFEGFSGRYRFKQLKNTHQMSELQLTGVMEQTISATVSAYLNMARWQQQLAIDRDNIAISYDRWQRVAEDAKFGAANSIRKLQAEVDLKTDSANYRNTLLAYDNSRRDLNLILALPADNAFSVEEDVQLSGDLQYEQLRAEMKANNTQLNLSQLGIDDAGYEVKISEATLFPRINGYANYTYFDTQDDANFLQSNTVYGPNVGVTLSWSVFTGGANKIQRQNARIRLEQQRTALSSTTLSLEKELRNAYAQYANNNEQLRIEVSNLETFERNYEKTLEDHKLGQVDASDLRTAQLNLASAKNRINDLTYNVKQSEINLLRLSGRLANGN